MERCDNYVIVYLPPNGDNEPCSAIYPGTSLKDALKMAEKYDGIQPDWTIGNHSVNPWACLNGRTVESAHLLKEEGSSDRGTLELVFTDGFKCLEEGGYIPQSADDCDGEYPTVIGLRIVESE